MPIYEYKCKKCGKEFEMFQGITDPAATACRFCSGPVRKMVSLSSFHLKGSGWYATDYSGKKAPASEKKADTKKETPTDTAADKSSPTTAPPAE
jgi:putative FmdB family regulatory protein